jgi:tetratricopeptide (TPR) repeat protein
LIKTNQGVIYRCHNLLHFDLLQDLAILEIEASGLKTARLQDSKRASGEEAISYPIKGENKITLRKADLTSVLPLSPRLEVLKLTPSHAAWLPGTPVFNRHGEVAGMIPFWGGGREVAQGEPKSLSYCLACDRTKLPIFSGASSFSRKISEADSKGNLSKENPINLMFLVFWEGVAATLGQKWERAQKNFSSAIVSSAPLPEAYYGRGVSRYHMQNYQGAAEDLLEATRKLPGYALAYFWLGKTWQKTGDQEAAFTAYCQAVEIAPDLHEAWFYLGELAYKTGDQEKAKTYLEKAASDLPQAALRAWYLGNIARSQQRFPESLAAFKQAIQVDPKFFPGYLEGGKLLLLDMGKSRKAIGWLSQAVNLKPQDAETRYFLSLAYHLSWNAAEAWKQYYELEKIQPDLAGQLAKLLEKSQ